MAKVVPLRKCVVSNEKLTKNELFRVVKNKEGKIFIDTTYKQNGRGVYLKKSLEVIEMAKKRKVLDRFLETSVSEDIYEELKKLL